MILRNFFWGCFFINPNLTSCCWLCNIMLVNMLIICCSSFSNIVETPETEKASSRVTAFCMYLELAQMTNPFGRKITKLLFKSSLDVNVASRNSS